MLTDDRSFDIETTHYTLDSVFLMEIRYFRGGHETKLLMHIAWVVDENIFMFDLNNLLMFESKKIC